MPLAAIVSLDINLHSIASSGCFTRIGWTEGETPHIRNLLYHIQGPVISWTVEI
jgi:hypothetical protein